MNTAANAARIEAVLLGTAQDGGVPQAGCLCERCFRARKDPAARKRVTSLGLLDHAQKRFWLLDATPDFREQLHYLLDFYPGYSLAGILLTHAHVGHYSGLIHLGREAWNASKLPVYVSSRMASFLEQNAPWKQLCSDGNIRLIKFQPGEPVNLGPGLLTTPVEVPHRDEWSDTMAFVVKGMKRTLFYCPDIDSWDTWGVNLRDFVDAVDVALLDGTFFDEGELPGRDLADVPHPAGVDTVSRLAGTSTEVLLIHLNHSNPLLDPGPERDWVFSQGIRVGELGQHWALD